MKYWKRITNENRHYTYLGDQNHRGTYHDQWGILLSDGNKRFQLRTYDSHPNAYHEVLYDSFDFGTYRAEFKPKWIYDFYSNGHIPNGLPHNPPSHRCYSPQCHFCYFYALKFLNLPYYFLMDEKLDLRWEPKEKK